MKVLPKTTNSCATCPYRDRYYATGNGYLEYKGHKYSSLHVCRLIIKTDEDGLKGFQILDDIEHIYKGCPLKDSEEEKQICLHYVGFENECSIAHNGRCHCPHPSRQYECSDYVSEVKK